jgi:phosphatidylethanolamine/phosphatidyl-N-methylethanolamine N-methyltransferase
VEVIISTLLWAAFAPSEITRPLLATLVESLSNGGAYTQVAYSWTRWAPPARRQLRQLRAHFEEVVISETICATFPLLAPTSPDVPDIGFGQPIGIEQTLSSKVT